MVEKLRFCVPGEQRPERLDKLLAMLVAEVSRTTLKRWIEEGRVRVDGRCCRPRELVGPSQLIEVEPGERQTSLARPEPGIELAIVYQDPHLLVVDKPSGLVVHPARGHQSGTLVNGLLALPDFHLEGRAEEGGDAALRPGIVHRIDKDTSGLLVIAKDEPTQAGLKAQLSAHTVLRTYQAITLGVPTETTLSTLHGRDPRSRLRFTTRVKSGRTAITHLRVKERLAGGGAALVECRLETGRTHQIRVHLAECAKTPILGDPLYGRVPSDPFLAALHRELGRQALHAATLGFIHPIEQRPLFFESPLPEALARLLLRLRA